MLNIFQELIIKNYNDYLENVVIPDLLTLNPKYKNEILKSYKELKPKISEEFLDTQIDTKIIKSNQY
jgi:hypothetical protein